MVLDRLQKTVGSFRLASFRSGGNTHDKTTALFRELQRYATHFKSVEKETQRWMTVVAGTFTSISDVMRVQLPKTYEETPEGQAIPSESDVGIIGEGVNIDGLAGAGSSHVVQLESVVQATQSWLIEFREVQNKMKTLESIRNDLVARNRKVASLKGKIDQLQQRVATRTGNTVARDEALLNDTRQQLEQAEQSVQAMEQNYHSTEEDTYLAELQLKQRCPELQACAANLINICQGTFRAAYDASAMSYGVASSLQSGGTLDKSGAVAYHLGDTSYQGYPQSPQAGGWAGNVDGQNHGQISYNTSEGESYNQAGNHYGWGAPKPDDYSIESARHPARYPKVNY